MPATPTKPHRSLASLAPLASLTLPDRIEAATERSGSITFLAG